MTPGDPSAETLLGRLALHYKLISREQLVEATTIQAVEGGRLGDLFVRQGWLKPQQLEQLLRVQQQMLAQQRAAHAPAGAVAEPASAVAATSPEKADAAPPAAAFAETPSAPAAVVPAPPVAPAAVPAVPAPPSPVPSVAPSSRLASIKGQSGRREAILGLLEIAARLGASDVHIHAGSPVRMRVNGELQSVGETVLSGEQTKSLLAPVLSVEQLTEIESTGQVDLALSVPGLGRYRVNIYRQQRGWDGVMRVISEHPPTLEALGLPNTLARFTSFHQGLVLITGPAGCGKSSTLAALVNIINEERSDHIITVEDPIEYVHTSKQSVVNQRQVRSHTESFARALRAALREDPDVIAIGELRDLETISLALTAAETGHLVIATLHTPSTIRTINRVLGVFPPEQQAQVRMMVSESLRGIVSQRLLPRADGRGRVAALEILINTKAIGNLIREEKTFQIYSILQTGAAQGMGLLDGSLQQLVKSGMVNKDVARVQAEDPKLFV